MQDNKTNEDLQRENETLRTENENLRQGALIVYKWVKQIYPYQYLRRDEVAALLEKIAFQAPDFVPES